MQGANLGGARMQEAKLWDAKLHKADLGDASMQDADCRGAVFHGAPLQSADLTCRNLTQAQLDGTIGHENTRLWADLHTHSCWTEPPDNLDALLTMRIENDRRLDESDRERLRAEWVCAKGHFAYDGERQRKIWGTVPRQE
ncbi:MAG: pentapeptide repeat-containing protein [Pseudomonadota bacterium]